MSSLREQCCCKSPRRTMGSQAVFCLVSFLVTLFCLVAPGNSAGCPSDVCGSGPDMYYPHPDDCSKFCQCVHGHPVEMSCAPGTVFSDDINVCVHRLSDDDECTMANAVRECQIGKVDLIPHPSACARYYDCSDTSPREPPNPFEKYEKECTHPELFDISKKQCVNFENAKCGDGRVEAKWKCHYKANLCRGSHCTPCNIRNPSCLSKADGVWPHPLRVWTPFFTTCYKERSKNGQELCPNDAYEGRYQWFHPINRQCTPIWEIRKRLGGVKPRCRRRRNGIYKVRILKKIFYRCPGEDKFFCDPPLSHGDDVSRCTPL